MLMKNFIALERFVGMNSVRSRVNQILSFANYSFKNELSRSCTIRSKIDSVVRERIVQKSILSFENDSFKN